MPLSDKPFDALDESDLASLVENHVPEGRTLEYKEKVGRNDEARKEFLKDVSSFANSGGGDLLVGVSEADGIPSRLVGLPRETIDEEKQWFDSLMQDALEPRIPGVLMRPIPIGDGSNAVILIRVPRSLIAPHVVKFRRHWRFYSRNSSGAYPIDVPELRTAFAVSETTSDRVQNLRFDRLSAIAAGETPIPMPSATVAPKVVLHVMPLSAFDRAGVRVSSGELRTALGELLPLGSNVLTHRYNFDGLVMYSNHSDGTCHAYLQLFRSGVIETVDGHSLARTLEDGRKLISSGGLARELAEGIPAYLKFLQDLGFEPPFFLMCTLLGVKGYSLAVDQSLARLGRQATVDRGVLAVPAVVLETRDFEIDEVLRPILDSVWNACGWEECLDYDSEGHRRARGARG